MIGERCLGRLQVGQTGRVSKIALPADYEQRLAELGILPGVDVSLVQVAPLGDPIAIEFEGRRMGMRRCDALGIVLE
ncbi:MAG: FeoA domain-containing protein [Opitutales bacterium]|nr:FeoA domain-containing protein [Opitutales bacterium]